MAYLNVYLAFNGQAEVAMNFYRSVFGGEITDMMRMSDMPPNPNMTVSDADKNKVMHCALPINDNCVLMASDAPQQQTTDPGNAISISIQAETEKEARALFDGLSQGGEIKMPLNHTFWKALFGVLVDQYGIQWMVNYQLPE